MSADSRKKPPSPEDDARDRRTANIFLFVVAAVLVGVGVWLANGLIEARRADECLAAGRRNCSPIDAPAR
jgi:hypothetical protein